MSSITISAESLNTITDNLMKIVEQIKALSTPKKTVTITFNDNTKTYVDHEYCDLFKETHVILPINEIILNLLSVSVAGSLPCIAINALLFTLAPHCNEKEYQKIYDRCRIAAHRQWGKTTKIFNNIPNNLSNILNVADIKEFGPSKFSNYDVMFYDVLLIVAKNNISMINTMHDILKRSVDEKVYKFFQQ
jgi:hypothetical protein